MIGRTQPDWAVSHFDKTLPRPAISPQEIGIWPKNLAD